MTAHGRGAWRGLRGSPAQTHDLQSGHWLVSEACISTYNETLTIAFGHLLWVEIQSLPL